MPILYNNQKISPEEVDALIENFVVVKREGQEDSFIVIDASKTHEPRSFNIEHIDACKSLLLENKDNYDRDDFN